MPNQIPDEYTLDSELKRQRKKVRHNFWTQPVIDKQETIFPAYPQSLPQRHKRFIRIPL
ncbi:hypothetical protein [Nitrosomonas sp. H1_AOB3]|uniref:hypothetical protein n=1 Tax=Nitrosomonas sp. H1_AOB3 TaxID=2741553 RepID=UPI001938EB1B|nr:hypothetical protein [Nitrosomonas sp. H1_AOB3]QOJ09460.1 MAG: hypothetical protein HRU73_08375 [Nitrosomonas sp. H1_AOB3]